MIGTSTIALAVGNKVESVLSSFPGLDVLAGQRGSVLFSVAQGMCRCSTCDLERQRLRRFR